MYLKKKCALNKCALSDGGPKWTGIGLHRLPPGDLKMGHS